ncbi:hypothetical protein [uncultured Acinetobacter sp.]|uniref:hypothetical protein n=1 Tax=uncultured Acinetobacter sp. TaxID=165433 RepID=UPI00259060C4|nr:hypothetical protein [uncultured Acinetobacter sp.]
MKKIVFLLSLILISETHAETLAQFEKKLIQHYTQKDFYEVNQTIESEVVAKIESDSRSFNYTFPTFQDQYNLRIHYSPDKRLKFYTFDVGSGGTMGEYSSYVQTQNERKFTLTPIDTGFILDVKQSDFVKQPIYLVENYYKGSGCIGAYAIHAFQPIKTGRIQPIKIFQTKTAKFDHIKVDFDCKNHEGPSDMPDYIRMDKNLNNIDIMLLDKNYKPQGKYLRYSKNNTVYQYVGVVE